MWVRNIFVHSIKNMQMSVNFKCNCDGDLNDDIDKGSHNADHVGNDDDDHHYLEHGDLLPHEPSPLEPLAS